MFSSEFCELFKNIYFLEDLRTAASGGGPSLIKLQAQRPEVNTDKETLAQTFLCEFCENFRKIFGRTPPSNQFSHDVFFLFPDQQGLPSKINLFGGTIIN